MGILGSGMGIGCRNDQRPEKTYGHLESEEQMQGRPSDPEIWTGPDETDCPSPIAEQLHRQSRSLDELGNALESLSLRLAGVLAQREPTTASCEQEQAQPKFNSELARALCHDVGRIEELRAIVSGILSRLEI